jgi:hypothetical protein
VLEQKSNEVIVRVATLADFPRLISMMFDYLVEFEKAALDDAIKDKVRKNIFDALKGGSVTFLLAEKFKHNKPYLVGYGAFDVRPDIFGNLIAWGHHLYVEPKQRSSSATKQIMTFAEQFAFSAGANEFYIDTPIPKYFKHKFGYSDLYSVVKKRLGVEAKQDVK